MEAAMRRELKMSPPDRCVYESLRDSTPHGVECSPGIVPTNCFVRTVSGSTPGDVGRRGCRYTKLVEQNELPVSCSPATTVTAKV